MALFFATSFWAQLADDAETFYSRIWWGNIFGFPFQMVLIYHFILSFTSSRLTKKQMLTLIGAYGYIVFLWGTLIFNPTFIMGTPRLSSTGWIGGAGPLSQYASPYGIGLIFIACDILIYISLFTFHRSKKSPLLRQQIIYLSFGILILSIAYHSFFLARYLGGLNIVPYLAPVSMGLMLLGLRKHAFFSIAPEPEILQISRTELVQELKNGFTYLIIEPVPKQSFEVFSNLVLSGYLGLCVSRYSPDKIRETYHLKHTPILWLSEEGSTSSIGPTDLRGLLITLKSFLQKAENPVLILHGLEYLISINQFNAVLRLVVHLSDLTDQKKGVLIIPVAPGILNEKQVNLMKAESPYLRWLDFSDDSKESTSQYPPIKQELHPDPSPKKKPVEDHIPEPSQKIHFSREDEAKIFQFLAQAFLRDYTLDRVSIESAGWRNILELAKGTNSSASKMYRSNGQPGPLLADLFTRGLLETRRYPGQRGRGGTVTKLRVNYSNPYVKAELDRQALQPNYKSNQEYPK